MLFGEISSIYINWMATFATIMPSFLANNNISTGDGLKLLGAGIAAFGMIGTGLGQGVAAQGACMAVGRNPEVTSKIRTIMIIGSGIAESGAIYALIIAILLVFVA